MANAVQVGHGRAAEFHPNLRHPPVPFAARMLTAYIDASRSTLNANSEMSDSTVDEAEVAKFSALAEEWWDPSGKFAPLHKFNPVRLGFIRDTAAAHFGRDPKSLRPFEGLSLLDIGCGGGLLSEPMARMGFAVTGADASERNIGTAAAHAAASGVAVEY